MTSASRIPVTVLTGFLGSGKTTLLNRILHESHGQRIAVIENELGEVGVDQALVINADEEIFELSNGCICCRIRGDLIRILGSLMQRRDRFDRILLETTGLANPGPVAQTFFIDQDIQEQLSLDGIVTLVDVRHIAQHLPTSTECQEQIAFADVLVLNKIDLVSKQEVLDLETRLRQMNPVARILRAERANVDLPTILEVGGFDLARMLAERPRLLEPEYPFEWTGLYRLAAGDAVVRCRDNGTDPSADLVLVAARAGDEASLAEAAERSVRVLADPAASNGSVLAPEKHVRIQLNGAQCLRLHVAEHGHFALSTEHLPEEFGFALTHASGEVLVPTCARIWKPPHVHEQQVGSIGVRTDRPVNLPRFESWLNDLLRTNGPRLYRTKGILSAHGKPRRWVFQSVHMLLEASEGRRWESEERRESLVVFIGKGLDEQALRGGFESCLQ